MAEGFADLMKLMVEAIKKSDLLICNNVANEVSNFNEQRMNFEPRATDITDTQFDRISNTHFQNCIALIEQIKIHRTKLAWRQPGFGQIQKDIVKHMSVCEIIGPSGQINNDKVRFGLFFQEPEITYPIHCHAAEEFYLTISGPSEWKKNNDEWCSHGAGDVIHHLPFQPHAIRTKNTPLLAIWGWTGDIRSNSYQI